MNASGNCRCDICGEKSFLDEHHISGRKIENYDEAFNVANICPNCHRKVHKNSIIIEKWAMTSSGKKLLWHINGGESISGENSTPHLI